MKRLIFYPGFESKNEKWLKFALLYFGRLSPIVPIKADNSFSELYKKLENETDLLFLHRPHYDEGLHATHSTIKYIKEIKENPYGFIDMFQQINVIRLWGDPKNHNYTLYDDKFSDMWMDYCLDNHFGTRVDEGIKLHESLAKLYMTSLANKIADDANISPVTDEPRLHKLSYFLNKSTPAVENEAINAMGVIELSLPRKLETLKWDEIIRLRNQKDFKNAQEGFHNELQAYLGKLENGDYSWDFYKKYADSKLALKEQLLTLSTDTAGVGLTTWLLLHSPHAPQISEVLKALITAGGIAFKQGFSINKTWNSTANDRGCRRYLATLRKLN